ncbi:hypothetical protein ACLOJK_006020 [Asimina triloba]
MYVIHRAAPYTISTLNAVPPSLPSPSFQASPKHPALALKFPSYSLACPSIFRFFSNHHKQMADFSPNLDDGELYLPSDIYPEELSTHFGSPEVFPSELTYMEELAQQLSSLAVIDRPSPQPSPKPPFSPCFEVAASPFYLLFSLSLSLSLSEVLLTLLCFFSPSRSDLFYRRNPVSARFPLLTPVAIILGFSGMAGFVFPPGRFTHSNRFQSRWSRLCTEEL